MRAGAASIALGSLCFLVLLAGCGGGGSGSSYAPPMGGGSSSASATNPTPSPSPYPQLDGAAYTYAGTLTQTFVSYPEVVPPGSPSPEPTSVTVTNVTQQITLKTNQTFNGTSGLTDYHNAETDALASGLKTTTSTTDTYETVTQSTPVAQLQNYGSQYEDEAGDTMTTAYVPQRVEDEIPETAGAQWSNGAGAQIEEAIAGDSGGSPVTVARTVTNAGNYTENTTYPAGYSAPSYTGVGQIQENSDGSGSYAWVSEAEPITIEYSVPVPQASGSPLITVGVFANLDPTAAEAPVESFSLASWYGPTPAFYNEIDKDLGSTAVPAACGLSSSLPQTATAIRETIDTLDTIVGYTEQETQTTYVANGYGPICTQLSDTQQAYYSFTGDQAFVFATLTPLQITTISETLGLQTSTSSTSAAKRALLASTSGAATPNFAAALRAHFQHVVETARRHNVQALMRFALTHHLGATR